LPEAGNRAGGDEAAAWEGHVGVACKRDCSKCQVRWAILKFPFAKDKKGRRRLSVK
jgi:hypothetical protein